MKNYHIWTIGCQMNQAESERLSALLDAWGLRPTNISAEADIILLNTCVVRQSAQDRVLGKLSSLKQLESKRRQALLAVTGCLVDGNTSQLHQRFPQVDFFFQPGAFDRFQAWAREHNLTNGVKEILIPSNPACFVPIVQGCDNFCSYCIVPYRRGRQHSRPLPDILREVSELVAGGTKEVTLLGQNVNAYGQDLLPSTDLAELLTKLNSIEMLKRIRFLTNHPKDMSPKIVSAMAELDKVCQHLNLPLQAGDDDILVEMRRGYSAAEYGSLVSAIRQAISGVSLSTDVIVGFPGESQEQFQRSYDLLQELRFDSVHVAVYSPRPGTLAARKLKDNVPPSVKKQRYQLIENLQERIANEINSALVGETAEILVEGISRGRWYGRTRTNKLVFFEDSSQWQGLLARVKIEKSGPWWLLGRLEANQESLQ
jgi:tRNA-2-methylthio-N6-dimethylallyladenosine synthase